MAVMQVGLSHGVEQDERGEDGEKRTGVVCFLKVVSQGLRDP